MASWAGNKVTEPSLCAVIQAAPLFCFGIRSRGVCHPTFTQEHEMAAHHTQHLLDRPP